MTSTPVSRMPSAVEDVENSGDVVRRVDGDGLARVAVADEVAEVDHLGREEVGTPDIASTEQLTEIETVFHGTGT